MNAKHIGRIAAGCALLVLLGSCMIAGGDDDTGGVRIGLPVVGSSAVSSGVDTARVWLYTASNLEYGISGGAARLPDDSANYAQASLTAAGGEVVIDDIPAGDGYRLVVVLGTLDGSVFTPIDVAESDAFEIAGGRETRLSLTAALAGPLTTALEGIALNAVVETRISASDIVFSSSTSTVYQDPFSSDTSYGVGDYFGTAQTINSVSVGRFSAGNEATFVNTDTGVYSIVSGGSPATINTALADSMTSAGIADIVDSGAFYDDASGDTIIYYERLGGIGGASLTDLAFGGLAADAWEDSGDDLGDYIDEDESPVRAAANNTTDTAYIASVLGTFAVTQEYYETDFDAGAIIAGNDEAGLTFWGVAYPGNDRPLRITQLGYIETDGGEYLAVGTPRGAFTFPVSAIARASDNGGLIPADDVTQIASLIDQPILDLSVNDGYAAFLTARSLTVTDALTADLTELYSKPLRSVTLGAPSDVFVAADGSAPVVYIAGSTGLTSVTE